ncbi:MAG: ParB/RepB/Spo0J family partition protein [Saprospiraceae bacterium]|nr:ParB/RepB/Spo0J family partition protein [Bacteroidia bacterium]MBT8230798.1 ParB/RepB/Spo0J family partition protein [Bacteroidia bacterium]NNF20347.1 ParB/RepB/Spo0J family partition protein [Saprospiraceae bacterium]NNK89483.1 ParB/RepB/Spo0J family partition protein [Saprospiraceae bacterium]
MSKKKEQLGKGLRALLSNIDKVENDPVEKKEVVKELSKTTAEVPIEMIEVNPFQPRKEFDQTELLQLVASIKAVGLIQPLTLRKIEHNKYQIIAGERRWRASKLAGLKSIPAYIRLADDQGMLEMALIENIQRSNLNALEIALSYQRLIDECQLQHADLAKRVGKERSTVSNYIRLLKLPPQIQSGIKESQISMGHARAILSLEEKERQLYVFKQIVDKNLSVRNTEKFIKDLKTPKTKESVTKAKMPVNPEVVKIQDRLSHHFGSRVEISRNIKGKGKLIIHFSSDDQLNDILDSIEE